MDKLPDKIKEEIWAKFDEHRVVHLATMDETQPRVRPVTMVPLDSQFWILTGKGDEKMKQLKSNPQIEVCYPIEKDENTGYARFSGRAIIIEDFDIKKDISRRVNFFKHYWKGPEDPNFALLKMVFKEVEYLRPGEPWTTRYSI